MLLGMVLVFQIPTVVFFLAKLGLVAAVFLWQNTKYAVFIIFMVAAVLTPSADPWNQAVSAAPMIGLYLISIGIAWMVGVQGTVETLPPIQGGGIYGTYDYVAPQVFRVSSTALALGTTLQRQLSGSGALQSTLLAGMGYGAGGGIGSENGN